MKNSSIINKKTESGETNSVFILPLTGYLIYFDFFKWAIKRLRLRICEAVNLFFLSA